MENNKVTFHFEQDDNGVIGKVQGTMHSLILLFCEIYENKPEIKELVAMSLEVHNNASENLKKKKPKKTPKHVN